MESAALFGFRSITEMAPVDVLRAAGAGEASVIAVCINDPEAASRIVDLVNSEFPEPSSMCVPSTGVWLQLLAKGVEFELRETYESAMVFGRKTLEALGLDAERAAAGRKFVEAGISIGSLSSRPRPFSRYRSAARAWCTNR